jgi:hypothetical protein
MRRPIPFSALAEYTAGLMAKPPLPADSWRSLYDEVMTTDESSVSDDWRKEFLNILIDITKEPTWTLQKRTLLQYLVTEIKWRALYDIVKADDPVNCWRKFANFKDLPDRLYYRKLIHRYLLAVPTDAVLSFVGKYIYSLGKRHEPSLLLYYAHRKQYVQPW